MPPLRRTSTCSGPFSTLVHGLALALLTAYGAGLSLQSAFAHEYWLAPSTYEPTMSDTVVVRAFVGTGFRGERRPFAAPRTVRFRLGGTKDVDLAQLALNGAIEWARVRPADTRGAVVSYESNFVSIELPAAEFEHYLEIEGLEGAKAERARKRQSDRPGRERYRRACKSWLAGTDIARVSRPSGLPLEIVPLADPAADGLLRVRILFDGKPLAGALVRGWRQTLETGASPRSAATRDSVGPSVEARTDAAGEATFSASALGAGEWLLSTVHMIPSRVPGEADWESTWASLTFARLAPPGRKPR